MTARQNSTELPVKQGHSFTKELSSAKKSALKGMAHPLKSLVQIGSDGITAGIIEEINRALHTHELIKIQLPGQSDAATKTQETALLNDNLPKNTHIVARIGRTVILYMEIDPKKEPKIILKKL